MSILKADIGKAADAILAEAETKAMETLTSAWEGRVICAIQDRNKAIEEFDKKKIKWFKLTEVFSDKIKEAKENKTLNRELKLRKAYNFAINDARLMFCRNKEKIRLLTEGVHRAVVEFNYWKNKIR